MHAHNFFQYIHVMDKQVTAAYNRKDHALHLSGWVKVTFTNAEGMLAFTNAIDRRIDAYITNYDINNIVALLLPHLNKHAVQKFGIRHVCLRRLTLSKCGGSKRISAAIAALKGLVELDIGEDECGPNAFARIVRGVSHLRDTLARLDIGSSINCGPKGVVRSAEHLSKLINLKQLDFSGNNIGPVGAALLAPALLNLKRLHTVSLSNNNLGDEGIRMLLPVIELQNIQHVELGYNKLGDRSRSLLADLEPKLRGETFAGGQVLVDDDLQLDLSNIVLPDKVDAAKMAAAILKLERFPVLLLGGSTELVAALLPNFGALTREVGVRTLGINDIHIGDAGGTKKMAAAIVKLKGLTALDISGNGFRQRGFARIARGIKPIGCTLEELNVGSNRFGPKGAEIMASNLMFLHKLKHLNFDNNNIGPTGAAALARGLMCMRLQTLMLNKNALGLEGTERLLPAIKATARTEMSGNEIGEAGFALIARFESKVAKIFDTIEEYDASLVDVEEEEEEYYYDEAEAEAEAEADYSDDD